MPPLRRTTARKSVTPAPARLCFVSNPRYGVELPAASNDVSFDSELDKAISPVPGIFSASSSAAAEAALDPNNAALETKEEDVVFVPFNDAAFVASSECSAGMEVSRDECKVDCDIVESGKYDVVDGGQQVVVDCEGEKVKKVVKKTVKVVKIVKRMVRRKVSSEGADDAKVDNVAEILSPDSRVSCVVESKELEPGSSSVGLNMQNLNSQVEEAKENTLMEIDNNGVVQKQTALVMEVDENRNGEYEHGSEDAGNVDRQEEEEEEVVEEAEEGVVKCFSAKLEAMERRKRRKTEVFVDGLDKDAKEEDVRTVFAEAGEIVDLTVLVNSKTGKNEGYAFVRYATTEEAKRALKKFSRVKICGKECGATPLEKNDTILLGNIDKEWKNEDIIKTLQGIGIENIDRVTVMVDQDNSEFNQGFAFVELETSKDAQIAYKKLQKKYVSKRNMGIKVAWAKPLKEFEEEDLLKKNVNVYFATVPESKILKPAAKILSKQSPNDPKISHRSDPVLVGVRSVPSYTALKARVVSLEKQRFDALCRSFKAEEATSQAEKLKEASKKKLQAKKEQIKNLKKKHKNEIKDLRRKHKAFHKKVEDWGFNKGKEYQLDLMKEALAFFDEKFRFNDFVPSLEYIEDERKNTLEAAVQLMHSKTENSTSLSKAIEP